MKRLESSNNSVHILPAPSPIEPNKSNFDISKLLQILPKLNLEQLFNKNNEESTPAPNTYIGEFTQTVNFMSEHNKNKAISILENHVSTINKLQNK